MPEHEIFGVQFDSKDVDYLTVKRDGRTIRIQKDEQAAVIKGFAIIKRDEPKKDQQ